MNKIFFRESQQFRQLWLLILLFCTMVPLAIFSIYALVQQMLKGIPIGDNPAPNWIIVVQLLLVCGLLILFFVMKLEVFIDKVGIHYRFFPLIWKTETLKQDEKDEYKVRKYNPIGEYGGWGIKSGLSKNVGKAYNVSGNMGLQLILTNDKKVLFGTQKAQSILFAMETMMKTKE